jgi:hypothetical protein
MLNVKPREQLCRTGGAELTSRRRASGGTMLGLRAVLVVLFAAPALAGCGVEDGGGGGERSVATNQQEIRVSPVLDLEEGVTSAVIALPIAEDGQYSISYEFTRTHDDDEVILTLLDDATMTELGSVTIDPLPTGVTPNSFGRCNGGASCLFATHQAELTKSGLNADVRVRATSISPGGAGHSIHIETIRIEPTRLTTFVDPNVQGFESAVLCSSCHGEQYAQWRSSMMGYSSISPPIHALELTENHVNRPNINDSTPPLPAGRLSRRGPIAGGPANPLVSPHAESGLFCQRCHSPVGVYTDVFRVFADFDFANQPRGTFPDSHGLLRQLGGYDALDPSLLRANADFDGDGMTVGDVDMDGVPGTFFDEFPDPLSAERQRLQAQVTTAIEGVTCTVCHSINGIDESGPMQPPNLDPTTPPANRSSRPQFESGVANNAFRVMHNDEASESRMNLGPYDDFGDGLAALHPAGKAGGDEQVQPGTDLVDRPFIRSGEFCGTCHDVRIAFPDEGTDGQFTVGQLSPGEEPYRRVENLFTEWRNSVWNNGGTPASPSDPYKGPFENPGRINDNDVKTAATCQDCHMSQFMTHDAGLPGEYDMGMIGGTEVRRRSNHRFIGVDRFLTHDEPKPGMGGSTDDNTDDLFAFDISQGRTNLGFGSDFSDDPVNDNRDLREIMLQKAFAFRIEHVGQVTGGQLPVRVSVENIAAGHNIPAGLSQERQVWIELEVLDANQNNVYTSGYLNLLEDHGAGFAHDFDPFGTQRYDESFCGMAPAVNEPFCDLDSFRAELGPFLNIISIEPGLDTQLANYQNGFTLDGSKVFTQFIADHIDDTPALRPFQKRVEGLHC